DGEHIVDDECGAGDQAGARAKEPRGDAVAAAAGREQRYRLIVAKADDEHRDRGGDGDIETEARMLTESQIGRLGPVIARGEAVGTQPDPGKEGDEQQALARARRMRALGWPQCKAVHGLARIKNGLQHLPFRGRQHARGRRPWSLARPPCRRLGWQLLPQSEGEIKGGDAAKPWRLFTMTYPHSRTTPRA